MCVQRPRNSRQASDVLNAPAYATSEAAKYLQLPVSTVRAWVQGYPYGVGGERRRFKPLVQPADATQHLLSFTNLVELHVLSAVRRDHCVPMGKVRRALDYMRKELETPRPLIDQQMFATKGQLFVQHLGRLLNVTQEGQHAMEAVLASVLERVERSPKHVPIRLFPFSTTKTDTEPRLIVIDPAVQFGRPCLVGTGIPTEEVHSRFKAGESMEDVADDFGRSVTEVQAAIRYESQTAA